MKKLASALNRIFQVDRLEEPRRSDEYRLLIGVLVALPLYLDALLQFPTVRAISERGFGLALVLIFIASLFQTIFPVSRYLKKDDTETHPIKLRILLFVVVGWLLGWYLFGIIVQKLTTVFPVTMPYLLGTLVVSIPFIGLIIVYFRCRRYWRADAILRRQK